MDDRITPPVNLYRLEVREGTGGMPPPPDRPLERCKAQGRPPVPALGTGPPELHLLLATSANGIKDSKRLSVLSVASRLD